MGNASTKKIEPTVGDHNAKNANDASKNSTTASTEHSSHMQFFPVDSLAKTLSHITYEEQRINGITESVFVQYVFPNYPELAKKLFSYLRYSGEVNTPYLSVTVFKQQVEKFLSIMNDRIILEMYSCTNKDASVDPETLRSLMMSCYQLMIDGTGTGPCPHVDHAIGAVVSSCFHGKDSLSVSYVANWLWQNCPRTVHTLHNYIVHVLTTAYRNGKVLMSKEQPRPQPEMPSVILESSETMDQPQSLLPLSYVWLLSSVLPKCYLLGTGSPKDVNQTLLGRRANSIYPRHWTLLYNSLEHGSGANRFLHHVLGYRGPTLLFIRTTRTEKDTENPMYCICSAVEWRESHLYWGDEDSLAIELLPSYKVIERGAKLLYLNTSIRGYPHGLRFGSDPRVPHISIDESFQTVSIERAPYPISSLEVWGCGDPKLREKQLEIKKWQVKEAEKQRVVKLTANDWLDHPDRYLLELAGRASYNESNN